MATPAANAAIRAHHASPLVATKAVSTTANAMVNGPMLRAPIQLNRMMRAVPTAAAVSATAGCLEVRPQIPKPNPAAKHNQRTVATSAQYILATGYSLFPRPRIYSWHFATFSLAGAADVGSQALRKWWAVASVTRSGPKSLFGV